MPVILEGRAGDIREPGNKWCFPPK